MAKLAVYSLPNYWYKYLIYVFEDSEYLNLILIDMHYLKGMVMTPTYSSQRRPSWRGVLAGLVMGLIVVMAMIALALVLSSFLPFDLKGTSIAGGIYAAVTAVSYTHLTLPTICSV